FQAEDGIRDRNVTGVQTCALPIYIDAMMDEIGPTISQLDNGELDLMLLFNDEEVEGFEDTPLSVDNDIDVIDGQGRGLVVNSDRSEERRVGKESGWRRRRW